MTQLPPRVVLVGFGHLGRYHAEKLAALDAEGLVEFAGIVEIDAGRRRDATANYDVPTWSDLAEADSNVTGAIIAAPTRLHAALATQAIQRGWGVLVEKPLCTTVAEGRTLVALADRQGVLLQVGHSERFNPAITAALRIADRPRFIVGERLGPFTGRSTDVDVVLDLMIHDLDVVAALIPAALTEVRAIGVPVLTQSIDMASARLQFADGSVAQLAAGRASLEPSRKLRLFTVERYVSIDCVAREVKSVRRLPAEPGAEWPQVVGEPVEVPAGDNLLLQDRSFVEALAGLHPPVVDGHVGLRALEFAEAIKAALQVPGGDVASGAVPFC